MKMYKVTFAVKKVYADKPGIIKTVRKELYGKLFCSPHEATDDYIKLLSNPFAYDVKIESVEV